MADTEAEGTVQKEAPDLLEAEEPACEKGCWLVTLARGLGHASRHVRDGVVRVGHAVRSREPAEPAHDPAAELGASLRELRERLTAIPDQELPALEREELWRSLEEVERRRARLLAALRAKPRRLKKPRVKSGEPRIEVTPVPPPEAKAAAEPAPSEAPLREARRQPETPTSEVRPAPAPDAKPAAAEAKVSSAIPDPLDGVIGEGEEAGGAGPSDLLGDVLGAEEAKPSEAPTRKKKP